ncbi:unnamed protein product [Paramecium primaurelia]|uniref:BART domain-containing protein n=2 Tax=Paramecium TaxID=5884 RepID=A0A8S1UNT1_9CILI|nr:unnamed protein product [Paramecium primaurelia]CAD8166064.1 unnamed protein product [Paramecium pentaurelia]
MKATAQDLDIIRLLSSKEWQAAYKNFVYQFSSQFSENQQNLNQQQELHKKFQESLQPIANKFISNESQEKYKKNIKELLQNYAQDTIIQFICLFDFRLFQTEMISQNQLLDLIALELIRKEAQQDQQESSSDDEEAEKEYFEKSREQTKQQIEGTVNVEEEKQKLEKTIRDTIANFNLPEVIKQPDIEVDQYGFNQGVTEKEDDILKKSIKLRTLKLKQTIPKKEIRLTAEQMKKRRLQIELVKKAINEQ